MSLGLRELRNPRTLSPKSPFKPGSPAHTAETSTQLSPSPKSRVTPPPNVLTSGYCSPPRTDTKLYVEAKESYCMSPNNSLDGRHIPGTPSQAKQSISMKLGQTPKWISSSSDCTLLRSKAGLHSNLTRFSLRKSDLGQEESKIILVAAQQDTNVKDLEDELKKAQKEVIEKAALIRELKELVLKLEEKNKRDGITIASHKLENQVLVDRLKKKETESNSKFAAEIQRLTNTLSENSKKFYELNHKMQSYEARIAQCTCTPKSPKNPAIRIPPSSSNPEKGESKEFCMFLIEENKRVAEELSEVKHTFQHSFASLLTSLAAELANIRVDVVQLKTLLSYLKTGEQMNLEALLTATQPVETKEKVGSYSAECMKEVVTIKKCVQDMKKTASDFYAEQCGQVCTMQ